MSEAWKLRRHVDKRDGSSSGWIVFTPEGPITYEIGTPLTENTACLIAAAPDMLAALEAIQVMHKSGFCPGCCEPPEAHDKLCVIVSTAIAKSKGETVDR